MGDLPTRAEPDSINGFLHAAGPSGPNAETSPYEAKLQAEAKLALHGSIDRWPALSLLPGQFPTCVCGRPRHAHKLVGTQRMGVGDCQEFRAPVELDSRRRRRG